MKIINKLIFCTIFTFLFFGVKNNIFAQELCNDTKVAENIKVKYELKNETIKNYNPCPDKECDPHTWEVNPPKGYYYNLIISNLNKGMYVEISNDYKENYETIDESLFPSKETFDDTKFVDNLLVYESTRIYYMVNYTIDIYDKNSSCLLKTLKIKTPFYNEYKNNNKNICKKIPKFKYCQDWLTEKITEKSFYNKALSYANKNNININKEIPDIYKENKEVNNVKNKINLKLISLLILGVLVILTIITGIIVRSKRK